MTEIEKIEQENVSLRECISSVFVRLIDYDGYEGNAEGLKSLIDDVVSTLKTGYPERLVDYKDREVCPLCLNRKDRL